MTGPGEGAGMRRTTYLGQGDRSLDRRSLQRALVLVTGAEWSLHRAEQIVATALAHGPHLSVPQLERTKALQSMEP
jgi:hypothetical protein